MRGVVIAGTHSGAGKTMVTRAVIAGLQGRGLRIAAFKAGPDFIDAAHLAAASGGPCANLDGWMMGPTACQARLARAGADVAVVEGMMGLYDGRSGASNAGSTAELAQQLELPVVLVADAAGGARSLAATVLGFQQFDPGVRLAGVIFNRVGGPGHMAYLREALAELPDIAVLGGLAEERRFRLPERHLGLVMPEETAAKPIPAVWAEAHLDLNRLLALAAAIRARPRSPAVRPADAGLRMGVARDAAFCFYYPDNLERLEAEGVKLVEFSPLRDRELPPELDGLYLGGGYPELHSAALEQNGRMRAAIHAFGTGGGFIYAECGGLMYLAERLGGHAMVGLVPGAVEMQERVQAIGYREVNPVGLGAPAEMRARGHEFHYSRLTSRAPAAPAHRVLTGNGEWQDEGYCAGNTVASYLHLHFASQPALAGLMAARMGTRTRVADLKKEEG